MSLLKILRAKYLSNVYKYIFTTVINSVALKACISVTFHPTPIVPGAWGLFKWSLIWYISLKVAWLENIRLECWCLPQTIRLLCYTMTCI